MTPLRELADHLHRLAGRTAPIAVALGLAFAAGIVAAAPASDATASGTRVADAGMHGADHEHRHRDPQAQGHRRGMDRMLEHVGATEAQRTQIEQITQAARDDMMTNREAARALRGQLTTLFAQPAVDAAAAEALRRQMMALHEQASQRRLQTMLEISQVLTPEQRAQIAAHRLARAERMAARHRPAERRAP